jgi:hypothetical protein
MYSIASTDTEDLNVISTYLIFEDLKMVLNTLASSKELTESVGKNLGRTRFMLVIKY